MGEPTIRKILLAYDGSDDSGRAANLALSLAEKYQATVIVCHASGNLPITAKPSQVRRLLNPILERLGKLGITTEVSIADAEPAQGILDTADAFQADLIVIGCRGLGTFANLLIGSTSERVVRHAKIPVLVAR